MSVLVVAGVPTNETSRPALPRAASCDVMRRSAAHQGLPASSYRDGFRSAYGGAGVLDLRAEKRQGCPASRQPRCAPIGRLCVSCRP